MKLRRWHLALLFSLLLVALTPLASRAPDGLESVAQRKGFLGMARRTFATVIPDYLFPGVHHEALATVLAGLVGTILVFALVYMVAWALRRRPHRRQGRHPGRSSMP